MPTAEAASLRENPSIQRETDQCGWRRLYSISAGTTTWPPASDFVILFSSAGRGRC